MVPAALASLPTLATAAPSTPQRLAAGIVCLAFTLGTLALLPVAGRALPPMPGFVASYQSALIVVYAVTTALFFAQFSRTRSVPLLLLATGSLFTTLMVSVQLLTFPNVFTTGRLLGAGPDTTTWLWTFWHIGPPLFALPYAVMEGGERDTRLEPAAAGRAAWAATLVTLAMAGLVTLLVARYVHWLPKSVEGDDYWLLTTSGIGPSVAALTVLALAILIWATRLRTVLQLWLAVSLFLLVLDNWITMAGAARGTVGWFVGRLEALIAGAILLGVYLREVDFLYSRAEQTADERGRERAALVLARDNLALALSAAEMGDWHLDLVRDTSRRTLKHDQIFGYDHLLPEWGKATFLEHVFPDDRAAVEQAFTQALETGALEFSCRIHRANDGGERWIAVRGKTYYGDDGRPAAMAGVLMDTTDRREMEERLAQSQKMEAIGQLTGGVAHDFNNLLTVVVGNLDMIMRRPDDSQRVHRLASLGLLAAKRGAEVTEKLLAFSRRQLLRPETLNPNRLLRDFKPLLSRAVGEAIEVILDLDPALHPVRLDPGRFESVILNLAVNARDAMPEGGRLTVKTCNVLIEPSDLAAMPELAPGEYILVLVSDTGGGMDAATVKRAFEPFFTTKDVGKGTGLGLSQVYGFAQQAGGQVRIESAVGKGTTVKIYLPRSGERAEVATTERSSLPMRRAERGEVILVVEDDAAVMEMAVESLEELGYRTLTATNAHLALERLRGPERIDIMFSDVVMPGGMNGVQLAVEARRLRPALRVVLASGYVGSGVNDLPEGVPLLSKPYGREELAKTLNVVLARA
jgi:PAS domain S-box-containing protein